MAQMMLTATIWIGALCLPALADEFGQAAAKQHAIQTKDGDFRVVSDRDESVPDFFRRHRILLGGLSVDAGNEHGDLQSVITATAEIPEVWLHHASPNDDPDAQLRFITKVRISPPTPEVKALLVQFK